MKLVTARQAQLNFFEKEVAQLSQLITEHVIEASPKAKEVNIITQESWHICHHVSKLYEDNGFATQLYDNHNGTHTINISWRS